MKQEITGASATTPAAVDSPVGSIHNKGTAGGWYTAPATGNRPVLRSSAGKYWLEFDGTTSYLAGDATINAVTANVSGLTLASARYPTDTATQWGTLIHFSTGVQNDNTRAAIAIGADILKKASVEGRRLDADSYQHQETAADIPSTTWQVQFGVFDYPATTITNYINNSPDGSNSSFQTAGSTSNTPSLASAIRWDYFFSTKFNGRISSVVVTTSALGATDRTNLYTYQAKASGLLP